MYFLRNTSQQFQSVPKSCTKLTKNIPLNLARSPLKDIKSNRNLFHLSRTTTFNFNLLETHLHKICWHVGPMSVPFSLPRLLYPLLPVFASIPTNAKNGWFDLADRPWPRLHFPRATPVREIAISPSLDGNASQRPWPCPNKTQPWRPGDRCDRHRQPVQLQPGELDPNWFSRVPGLDASRAFVVYATSTGHPPISKSVSRVQHGGGDQFRFLCPLSRLLVVSVCFLGSFFRDSFLYREKMKRSVGFEALCKCGDSTIPRQTPRHGEFIISDRDNCVGSFFAGWLGQV